MNLPVSSNLRVSKDVLCQTVGAETVLLDMQGETYFGLNCVGARIWQFLKEGREIEQMITILGQEFDAPKEQLWTDVEEILSSMMDRGLLQTK